MGGFLSNILFFNLPLTFFSIADSYHFSIEIFKKFGEFFFGAFYHISDFHIIKSTDNRTAIDTLNQAKFLALLSRYVHSLKLMMFTGRTF
jgi:hypothetical protein